MGDNCEISKYLLAYANNSLNCELDEHIFNLVYTILYLQLKKKYPFHLIKLWIGRQYI